MQITITQVEPIFAGDNTWLVKDGEYELLFATREEAEQAANDMMAEMAAETSDDDSLDLDTPCDCETCGETLDYDCNGRPRCPDCDGPCPCCYDGGMDAQEGDYCDDCDGPCYCHADDGRGGHERDVGWRD